MDKHDAQQLLANMAHNIELAARSAERQARTVEKLYGMLKWCALALAICMLVLIANNGHH